MTPRQFIAWRRRLGLGVVAASRALKVSREAVRLWENGRNPIPGVVTVAMAAVSHGLKPEGTRK